jgi:hypothetical protein
MTLAQSPEVFFNFSHFQIFSPPNFFLSTNILRPKFFVPVLRSDIAVVDLRSHGPRKFLLLVALPYPPPLLFASVI